MSSLKAHFLRKADYTHAREVWIEESRWRTGVALGDVVSGIHKEIEVSLTIGRCLSQHIMAPEIESRLVTVFFKSGSARVLDEGTRINVHPSTHQARVYKDIATQPVIFSEC